MTRDSLAADSDENRSTTAPSERSVTRRRALALVGSGLVTAGAAGSASVAADSHEADVWSDRGTWYAEAHGSRVYTGGDMFDAVRAAIDGLSGGRNWKETVVVWDGGSGSGTIELPSYTVLDFRGTIDYYGDGTPIYADYAESIAIPNYSLEGSPGMGMRLQRCNDVSLGDIEMSGGPGIGVRIDNAYETGNAVTTENVRIDTARISGTGSHAVETYGVHDIDIGTVETRDTGGCGLLLNDTSNADVDRVDAVRADEGGGYAGFRCANDAGPDIRVGEVRAVDCGRGIFTVSGSRGIAIDRVDIRDCGSNLIQDTRNVSIDGGTVESNAGEGFRIDSRDSGSHHHTRDVTIQNVGIYGNDYGVLETGPGTEANAILDNDFCDNGTAIETYADSTVVRGNTSCEGTPGDGNGDTGGTDGPISEGTYRITNVNSGSLLEVEAGSTENGANVQQWSDSGCSCQQWRVREEGDGVYVLENVNSGQLLDVEAGGTDDGDTLIQWPDNGGDNQRFYVEDVGGGEYRLENVNSGLVVDVYGARTADGVDVIQWEWNGGANQRWRFEEV